MSVKIANIIVAFVLITVGGYAYLTGDGSSFTPLIPVIAGAILGFLTFGLDNSAVAHIVVILTLLLAISMIMPLRSALGKEDMNAVYRVGAMMGTCVIALLVYISYFTAARKARKAA